MERNLPVTSTKALYGVVRAEGFHSSVHCEASGEKWSINREADYHQKLPEMKNALETHGQLYVRLNVPTPS